MKSEWTLSTIGDVCLLVTDGSHFSPKSVENGEPMVSVKDFTPYGFDFSSCRKISDTDYATLKKNGCVPEVEDILIGKDGARYFEDIIIYRQNERPALLSSIAILRCDKSKILPDYLYYILRTPFFRKNVKDNYGSGSAIPRIILKDSKRMPICYPSIKHQKEIISILVALDQHIMTNQKINDNLKQQASALFKSWFIDFKQVPNCDFVNSEIGLIPNDWRVYKLSDFLPVITGKKNANVSSDKGAYPFFSCSQGISWTNDYSFDGHAILVAGNGDFNVKWYNGKFDAYQRTYVLIPYNKRFTSWLYYAVKYNLFNITSAARGSVIKFITKGNLENFAFAGPKDLDSLDVIDTFTTINHTIDKKTQENYRLSALRDALLPKLMSGEIDISAVQF